MQKTIYIQLLDEGTVVYRPVASLEISRNVYRVGGELTHDPENERWEFLPNTIVEVEEKYLDGDNVFVAVRAVNSI